MKTEPKQHVYNSKILSTLFFTLWIFAGAFTLVILPFSELLLPSFQIRKIDPEFIEYFHFFLLSVICPGFAYIALKRISPKDQLTVLLTGPRKNLFYALCASFVIILIGARSEIVNVFFSPLLKNYSEFVMQRSQVQIGFFTQFFSFVFLPFFSSLYTLDSIFQRKFKSAAVGFLCFFLPNSFIHFFVFNQKLFMLQFVFIQIVVLSVVFVRERVTLLSLGSLASLIFYLFFKITQPHVEFIESMFSGLTRYTRYIFHYIRYYLTNGFTQKYYFKGLITGQSPPRPNEIVFRYAYADSEFSLGASLASSLWVDNFTSWGWISYLQSFAEIALIALIVRFAITKIKVSSFAFLVSSFVFVSISQNSFTYALVGPKVGLLILIGASVILLFPYSTQAQNMVRNQPLPNGVKRLIVPLALLCLGFFIFLITLDVLRVSKTSHLRKQLNSFVDVPKNVEISAKIYNDVQLEEHSDGLSMSSERFGEDQGVKLNFKNLEIHKRYLLMVALGDVEGRVVANGYDFNGEPMFNMLLGNQVFQYIVSGVNGFSLYLFDSQPFSAKVRSVSLTAGEDYIPESLYKKEFYHPGIKPVSAKNFGFPIIKHDQDSIVMQAHLEGQGVEFGYDLGQESYYQLEFEGEFPVEGLALYIESQGKNWYRIENENKRFRFRGSKNLRIIVYSDRPYIARMKAIELSQCENPCKFGKLLELK